jgi:hypothetical protein
MTDKIAEKKRQDEILVIKEKYKDEDESLLFQVSGETS